MVVEWQGRAPIPKILQALLSPKMLCWRDTAIWDEKALTMEWQTKTFYYTDIVTIKGKWFVKEKDAGSIVVLDGIIKIDYPIQIFGKIAEVLIK